MADKDNRLRGATGSLGTTDAVPEARARCGIDAFHLFLQPDRGLRPIWLRAYSRLSRPVHQMVDRIEQEAHQGRTSPLTGQVRRPPGFCLPDDFRRLKDLEESVEIQLQGSCLLS